MFAKSNVNSEAIDIHIFILFDYLFVLIVCGSFSLTFYLFKRKLQLIDRSSSAFCKE